MHLLAGARERLKRADEKIQNLNAEITDFLKPAPRIDMEVENGEPVITDEHREAWPQIGEFIRQPVGPRFRILTGEILHHLRSAFDHLAWQLSSPEFQTKHPTRIEFPVFESAPKRCGKPCDITKDKVCRYCGKVQGIASTTALARIERLQPYLRTNPLRDPLWLIHDMDRIDKHRELILSIFIMQLTIAGKAQIQAIARQMPWESKPSRIVSVIGKPKVDMKIKMVPQITLGEFRGPDDEPIIPTLQNFLHFTRDSIESFASEFA